MDPYIKLLTETNEDQSRVIRDMVKKRSQDIDDFNNMKNGFLSKSNRIPVNSNDVLSSDIVGSFSYDATTGYLYVLGDNAGTVQWRRTLLGTF